MGKVVSKIHSPFVLVNNYKLEFCKLCKKKNYELNIWYENQNNSELKDKLCFFCFIKKYLMENETKEPKENKQMKLF